MSDYSDESTHADLFSFYREQRPEQFSDSRKVYDVSLTEELFDFQLQTLSSQKKHSEFENFILAVAKRLITPNILPQTGPDGGGDGKIDGETYEVSDDISAKWHIANEEHNGRGHWAIAISCKQDWKAKVKSDVKKIIESGCAYTRILFFTNQMVKGDKRKEAEKYLKNEFDIDIEIFDGNWCKHAVFENDCKDIAVEKLNFSNKYRQEQVIIGPNDKARKEKLDKIDKSIVRHVAGLDTDYIEKLREACLLSRGIESPRKEIESRFRHAMKECKSHGTPQQEYLIIYDFAWTSFFWFKDVELTYELYSELKNFIKEDCNVARLEKFLNIHTNLCNATIAGLFDKEKLEIEMDFIKSFEHMLAEKGLKSSQLYLKLHIEVDKLIYGNRSKDALDEHIDAIRPLLLESINHVDISFESLYQIFTMLNDFITDSSNFDKLVDDMAEKLSKSNSAITAANIHYGRAITHIKNGRWMDAVKHLGFCVIAFDREEYRTEMTKSAGLMGTALGHLDLPYSALVYLVKSAAVLIKNVYENGTIPRLLIQVLRDICNLELRVGRLSMYLVWHELLMVLVQNGDFISEKDLGEQENLSDAIWTIRLSTMNTSNPLLAILPDILERHSMHTSAEFLRYTLGYPEKTDMQYCPELFENENLKIREQLQNNELFEHLLGDTSLSTSGLTELKTVVWNCTINIQYENDWKTQIAAEMLLALIESTVVTSDAYKTVTLSPNIVIKIVDTERVTAISPSKELENQYILSLSKGKIDVEQLLNAYIRLLNYIFPKHLLILKDNNTSENKKDEEGRMATVACILQYSVLIHTILGDEVKYRIENWTGVSDSHYCLKCREQPAVKKEFNKNNQIGSNVLTINANMSLWEDAGWRGCVFVMDVWGKRPPILGLVFSNIKNGEKIVKEWELKDVNIFLIKGVDSDNPTHYRVTIAPKLINFKEERDNDNRQFSILYRCRTMTPDNLYNINRFEIFYNKFKCCYLKAFFINENGTNVIPNITYEDGFLFSNVIIKNAWEIGVSDEAKISLLYVDNPVIPKEHAEDAPVLESLKELRCHKK